MKKVENWMHSNFKFSSNKISWSTGIKFTLAESFVKFCWMILLRWIWCRCSNKIWNFWECAAKIFSKIEDHFYVVSQMSSFVGHPECVLECITRCDNSVSQTNFLRGTCRSLSPVIVLKFTLFKPDYFLDQLVSIRSSL